MTFSYYQEMARRTCYAGSPRERVLLFTLGLCGETGEVAELIKKWTRQGSEASLDVTELRQELGDVLWYLSNLADVFDVDLDQVADINLEKLLARYPDGFTPDGGVRDIITKEAP